MTLLNWGNAMHKLILFGLQPSKRFQLANAFSKRLPVARIFRLCMIVCALLVSCLPATGQVDNGGTTTPTVSDVAVSEAIDLYSGQLRLSIPLLHTNGRGSSYTDISISIQSEQIVGSGIYAWGAPYPEESYMFSDLYQNPAFNSPRFHREYYSQLYRFG